MSIFNRFARLGLTYTRFAVLSRGSADQAASTESSIPKLKRPVKPYMMFIEDRKEKMNDKWPNAETKAELHNQWNSLSDTTRMQYYDKYIEAVRVYYDTLYEHFKVIDDLRGLGPDDKKLLKKVIKFQQVKLKKPVRPLNEFLIFMKERAKGLIPGTKPFSALAQDWLALDESKKKVYRATAEKNLANYREELCKWEKDMADQGHSLLIRKKSRDEYLKNCPK